MSDVRRPLPVTDDPDTGGFFEAAARGVLAVLRCDRCGHVLHLPKRYCHRCGSWETTWTETSGRGRVYTWTRVERSLHPAFPAPYTVVVVELEDDPSVRFVGHLAGAPALHAGRRVRAEFTRVGEVPLVDWVLDDERS